MTPLRQRMIEDMQLRGLSPGTQRAYVRVVRDLATYYNKSPDQIEEEEMRSPTSCTSKLKSAWLEAVAPWSSVV